MTFPMPGLVLPLSNAYFLPHLHKKGKCKRTSYRLNQKLLQLTISNEKTWHTYNTAG